MYKYNIIGTPSDYSDSNNWYKIPELCDMKHDVDILYFMGTIAANPEGGRYLFY